MSEAEFRKNCRLCGYAPDYVVETFCREHELGYVYTDEDFVKVYRRGEERRVLRRRENNEI